MHAAAPAAVHPLSPPRPPPHLKQHPRWTKHTLQPSDGSQLWHCWVLSCSAPCPSPCPSVPPHAPTRGAEPAQRRGAALAEAAGLVQVPVSLQAELPGASAVTGGVDGVQGRVHGVHARLKGPGGAVSQHEGFTWNAARCSQCMQPSHPTLMAASSVASSRPSAPQPDPPHSQTGPTARPTQRLLCCLHCLQPSVLPLLPGRALSTAALHKLGAAVQAVGLQGSTRHRPTGHRAVLLNPLHQGGHEERSCASTTARTTQPQHKQTQCCMSRPLRRSFYVTENLASPAARSAPCHREQCPQTNRTLGVLCARSFSACTAAAHGCTPSAAQHCVISQTMPRAEVRLFPLSPKHPSGLCEAAVLQPGPARPYRNSGHAGLCRCSTSGAKLTLRMPPVQQ